MTPEDTPTLDHDTWQAGYHAGVRSTIETFINIAKAQVEKAMNDTIVATNPDDRKRAELVELGMRRMLAYLQRMAAHENDSPAAR
jgi:hypothetical protein